MVGVAVGGTAVGVMVGEVGAGPGHGTNEPVATQTHDGLPGGWTIGPGQRLEVGVGGGAVTVGPGPGAVGVEVAIGAGVAVAVGNGGQMNRAETFGRGRGVAGSGQTTSAPVPFMLLTCFFQTSVAGSKTCQVSASSQVDRGKGMPAAAYFVRQSW